MKHDIKLKEEYWAQPGSIRYSYKAPDNTLWNVSEVSYPVSFEGASIVHLWSINANGGTNRRNVNLHEFEATYKEHDEPSLYEQMNGAKS